MKRIKISILKLFLLLLPISCGSCDNKFYWKIENEEFVVTYKEDTIYINGEATFVREKGEYYNIPKGYGKPEKTLYLSTCCDTTLLVPNGKPSLDTRIDICKEGDNLYSTTIHLINMDSLIFYWGKYIYDEDYKIIEFNKVSSIIFYPKKIKN